MVMWLVNTFHTCLYSGLRTLSLAIVLFSQAIKCAYGMVVYQYLLSSILWPELSHVISNPRAVLAQGHLVVAAIATSLLELRRRTISICVVLVSVQVALIVLVVHVGGILLGLVVSTLAVVSVHAWCQH